MIFAGQKIVTPPNFKLTCAFHPLPSKGRGIEGEGWEFAAKLIIETLQP